MSSNTSYAVSDNVVSREVSGEFVLLDLESGIYFGLDKVGARIWELLSDRPHSIAELSDRIEAEFDAARETIEADLAELFEQLIAKELVVAS